MPRFLSKFLLFSFKIVLVLLLIRLTMYGWRPGKLVKLAIVPDPGQLVQRLEESVRVLSEDIGVRNYVHFDNLNRAAGFIRRNFEEMGYPVTRQTYTLEGKVFENIVAEKAGAAASSEIIIIGAHYDSCFNPGADDNASGVAGLLELARMLKDVPTQSTLRFVAFTNEEPPFFTTEDMGSRVYARATKAKGETIKAVVILEMIGFYSDKRFSQRYLPFLGPFYPNRANFIAIVGNFPSHTLVQDVIKGFRQGSDFPIESIVAPSFIPGIYFSDHWSFWKEGYPAVMVTDTAFLRSPHYHATTDRPETLDYERMGAVVAGLKEAIIALAHDSRSI